MTKVLTDIKLTDRPLETVGCPICRCSCYDKLFEAPSDPVKEFGYFGVVRCQNCELIFTNPRPPRTEIGRYYGTAYYGPRHRRFIGLLELLMAVSRRQRIRAIHHFKKTGRVLDIGCGRGDLLAKMKKMGWTAYGTELSPEAANEARQIVGETVREGEITEMNFLSEFFDCITLWHVLEHLYQPRETVEEIARILKPGGLLVVAVPNQGGRQARFGGLSWFHLDVPRHTTHFTRTRLISFLQRQGFQVVKETHLSWAYDTYGWLQTLYNRLGFEHNMLYTMARRRDWWKNIGVRKFLLATVIGLLFTPLFFISILLTIFDALTQANGTFTLFALKTTPSTDAAPNESAQKSLPHSAEQF